MAGVIKKDTNTVFYCADKKDKKINFLKINLMWIFTEKTGSKITRQELYGSIRAICLNEKIVIGVKTQSETQVRNLLKTNKYEDDRYRIEKKEVVRSKQFPI